MARAPKEKVSTKPAAVAVGKSYKNYNMRKQLENDPTTVYPFVFPGEGFTGESLQIRSQHSTVYREAEAKAQRQISSLILAAGGKPENVDQGLIDDIRLRSFTKLVASWTFEEEMTEDALVEFLTDNPVAYDEINVLAAQDSLFFNATVKS